MIPTAMLPDPEEANALQADRPWTNSSQTIKSCKELLGSTIFYLKIKRAILFIWKAELQREREKERDTETDRAPFSTTGSFQNWPQESRLVPKPRVSMFIPGSPLGDGTIFHCLPRCISRELDRELSSQIWTGTHTGYRDDKQQVNPLYHNASPSSTNFLNIPCT